MTCEDARQLLDAHVDRELDAATDREVARHLSECDRCAREVETIRALKTALGTETQYQRAPEALRRRIGESLGRQAEVADRPRVREYGRARWLPQILNIVVPAAVAAIVVALVVIPRSFRGDEVDFLLREVVAAHVRSTQASHLTDVASTDRHTVKPWFAGKIDFSPPVADFAVQGFKLVGGRVDYLDDRTVAALVYQHGAHVVNVFIWPTDESERAPVMTTRSGYNIDRFIHAGMNYSIVSDMSADEMQKLAALLIS
ncbi:MAG: anti-sigma factor family protein [Candidatus Binataceae bacterium]